jgi:hypothetical protein
MMLPSGPSGASLLMLCFVAMPVGAQAEGKFQKLTGAQIQLRLNGMEMTDGVHFSDVFERGGVLKSYAMGRPETGTWRVQNNQLCLDRGKQPGGGCYDVWLSGNNVELRTQGSNLPQEGTIQKPRQRK